jgi:hypothetical protein
VAAEIGDGEVVTDLIREDEELPLWRLGCGRSNYVLGQPVGASNFSTRGTLKKKIASHLGIGIY